MIPVDQTILYEEGAVVFVTDTSTDLSDGWSPAWSFDTSTGELRSHYGVEGILLTPDQARALAERLEEWAESKQPTYVECDATLNSWDYFNMRAVDRYDMRCDLTYPHDEHKNNETGAKWRTP